MAEDSVQRRLTTILAADVVGYSRMVAVDEEAVLRTLEERVAVFRDLASRRGGRVFKTLGDGVLVEFDSPVEAVRCAIDVQEQMRSRNEALPDECRMRFRIGINLGDVVVRGDDLLGDGVNIAARLEALAQPDGICVSSGVYEQILGKLTIGADDLGAQLVKNIPRPVHAFNLRLDGTALPHPAASSKPPAKPAMRLALGAAAAIALVLVGGGAWWFMQPAPGINKPATSSGATPPAVTAAPGVARPLIPERIPLASDRNQRLIRDAYLGAPDFKAIALSGSGSLWYMVGQPSEEVARRLTQENCSKNSREPCSIYAVGDKVVWAMRPPVMPPEPYVPPPMRGPPITLDPGKVPLLDQPQIDHMAKAYVPFAAPKALVLGPHRGWFWIGDAAGEEQAVRRVLEICGMKVSTPCQVYAVNDRVVVAAPQMFAVTSLLSADPLVLVPETDRERVRKTYMVEADWRALALARNGKLGMAIRRDGEADAVEAAIKDCSQAGGTDCEIFAVGPFRVVRRP